jgi:hypothetical protein
MTNYYLITTFVVLLTGAKAANKAQLGTRHLPDQGEATSTKGRLAHQRFGGLGRDVRVVDVRGVQSHLREELKESIEQGVGAPLQGGKSCLQDPKVGTIHSFSLFISFSY